MKTGSKLSPDDSNPQEVHGHLLFKKDGIAYSIPSLTHISGDSPPKNYRAWVFRQGFLSSVAERGKEKFFKRMNKRTLQTGYIWNIMRGIFKK
jgi:hypothetical protein